MNTFRVDEIGEELSWLVPAADWDVGAHQLSLSAGQEEDWFVDPDGTLVKHNAPCALFPPIAEDFILQAKVQVSFQTKYDAGALHVHVDEQRWAKVCFESSAQNVPTVVSVVTRGTSDDCNSVPIEGNAVYLRIAKRAHTFAFHYSRDGLWWDLVRHFDLGPVESVQSGFSAQAPVGTGCGVTFSEIAYRHETLGDIRSGR